MRRREFILGVGGVSALAAFPVARAQEAGRRYRIAMLTNLPREETGWPAFLDELGHGGFVEGGNLDVDYRGFGVAPPSLEPVAIELTRARPDVIMAAGPEAVRAAQQATRSIAIVAAAVGTYNIIAFGLPIDAFIFSFLPIPARIPLMATIACGTLPYFVADEWLTRGARARPGAYALTKFCFLLSLAIAVALNPMKLFFLVIIVPAILLLFLAFGLISRWSYKATHHPLPGALANAAVFAWATAVTFPMIVR